jgi:hypothetical protein
MYELTRGVATLIGAAVGGFLLWLATQVNSDALNGYWAEYGLIAGAGMILALALAAGSIGRGARPAFSPGRFLLGFVPVLLVVAWVVIAHQPEDNWFRSHVLSWSDELAIGGLVSSLGEVLGALALAAGAVFGFCFDTVPAVVATTVPTAPVVRDADEPLTAERKTVVEREPVVQSEAVVDDREPVAAAPAATADDGAAPVSRRSRLRLR